MIQTRYITVIALLLLFASCELPLALAQQAKERRVFTNEDVERAPRSEPAPTEAVAEPEQAPPASALPEGERVSDLDTEAPLSSSQMSIPQRLKSARFLQDTLRRYVAEYSENLDAEADPARQEGWRDMLNSLMNLMQKNQQYISDLDQQIAEQQTQASAEQ